MRFIHVTDQQWVPLSTHFKWGIRYIYLENPRDLFEHGNNDDHPLESLELYQELGLFIAEHEILRAQKLGGTQSTQSSVLSGGHHGIEAGWVQHNNIFSSRISWYPHAFFFVDSGKDTWMDSDIILQRSSKKKQLLRGFEG